MFDLIELFYLKGWVKHYGNVEMKGVLLLDGTGITIDRNTQEPHIQPSPCLSKLLKQIYPSEHVQS